MPLLYSKTGVGVTHSLSTETRTMLNGMTDWDTFSDTLAFHTGSLNRFFNLSGVRVGTSIAAVHNSFTEGDWDGSQTNWSTRIPLGLIANTKGLFNTVFQTLLDRKIIYTHLGWDVTGKFAIIEVETGGLIDNLGSMNFAWNSGLGGSVWTHGGVTKSFTKSGHSLQIRSFWFGGQTGINTGTAAAPQVTVTIVHRNGQVDNGTTSNAADNLTWNSGQIIGGCTIYLHWGVATVDDTQNWIIDDLIVTELESQNPRVQIVDLLKELQNQSILGGQELIGSAKFIDPDSSLVPDRIVTTVNPTLDEKRTDFINEWDYYYNGSGFISGIVSVENVPTVNKKVVLFDRYTNLPLATTFSDSLGRYTFSSVRDDVPHYVVSFDETSTFNAVVQDRVIP